MTNPLIEKLEALADAAHLINVSLDADFAAGIIREAAAALKVYEPDSNGAPAKAILDLFNEVLGDVMPKASRLPHGRRTAINARWNEAKERRALTWWKGYFEQIKASDFLCGRTKNPWRPNIDWLLKPGNMTKVLEGNYANRGPSIGDHNRAMLGFGA